MQATAEIGDRERAQAIDWLMAVGASRDRNAFSNLYRTFAPRLRSYLRGLGAEASLADDLLQEVMTVVWRRAHLFDPAKSAPATWLFTIARNKRIDGLRRERHPEVSDEVLAQVPSEDPSAERRVQQSQLAARISEALAGLPAEQSELLSLAYYRDMTHTEISMALDIPLGTVKSRIRLAMKKLTQTLDEFADFDVKE